MNLEDASHGINHTPRIIVSWLIVAIPLGYGFVETMKNAIHLFTG